ncbi:MAG: hypothetical protein Athens041674_935 [Parcubacteria group bacterium Athens0416_74]|nr:MAG: hypothetical protein Athens041674_935 [Parcubacteria group bacterium Athens0416_74]
MYSAEDKAALSAIKKSAENVDYSAWENEHRRLGQRSEGYQTYVVSAVNESSKYSEGYKNCTGVLGVGIDMTTGRNISFLTHQDPRQILVSEHRWKAFLSDLRHALTELKDKVDRESIDIVLFAGDYDFDGVSVVDARANAGKRRADDYRDVVAGVGEVVREVLGIDPRVVVGPKEVSPHAVNAIVDTQRRRLYMFRPEQEGFDNNTDFRSAQVAEHLDTLQNGRKIGT